MAEGCLYSGFSWDGAVIAADIPVLYESAWAHVRTRAHARGELVRAPFTWPGHLQEALHTPGTHMHTRVQLCSETPRGPSACCLGPDPHHCWAGLKEKVEAK